MSTQQARNILNNQIDSLIDRAKEAIKSEGRKKVNELKQKIPTPQELAKKLITDINSDTCGPKGTDKYMKIYNSILDKLNKLELILIGALEIIEEIESKIDPIVGGQGPISKIQQLVAILNPITQTLNLVLLAAPALFAANSGPTSSGAVQEQIKDKKDKANSKLKEYVALIAMVGLIIPFYISEARKVFVPIDIAKSKLTFIKDEISKIKLYLYALFLNREVGCAEFLDSQNPISYPPDPPDPPGPTELENYLAYLEDKYEDVYNQLQQAGLNEATERIFAVNQDTFEEDYNISFKTINF
jgi:hypothetical protein